MRDLTKNNTEMFCPRCGGKNELDSPEVKFCRFCGLSITESKDAVRGLTLIKRQGRQFTTMGYLTLQILFLVIFLFLIPAMAFWISVLFVTVFALSNGLFIAGNLAAENPSARLSRRGAKKHLKKGNNWEKNLRDTIPASVTEKTTRKLT